MRGNTVRKQVLIIAAAAVVVAAGVLLWYFLTQQGADPIVAEGRRTNVLCIGFGVDGATDALVLTSIAVDHMAFLAVPSDLRVKGPDGTFLRADGLVAALGIDGAREAIASLLGIEIAYTVGIDRESVVSWIDDLSGLDVTIEQLAVFLDESSDPPTRVEIRPGTQTMNGAEAVTFAVSPSEPDDAGRLVRQEAVARAMVRRAIVEPTLRSVRTAIRDLMPSLETDCSVGTLQAIVEAMREVPEDGIDAIAVPSREVVVDGESFTEPMIVEMERIVAATISGLDLLTPDEIKVAVFNGNGVRQMASRTADYLRDRGFQITRIANADSFGYPTSYVIVLSDEAKAWVLSDALLSEVQIVFPETFTDHYPALQDLIPAGTDLVLIAGAGMELE